MEGVVLEVWRVQMLASVFIYLIFSNDSLEEVHGDTPDEAPKGLSENLDFMSPKRSVYPQMYQSLSPLHITLIHEFVFLD